MNIGDAKLAARALRRDLADRGLHLSHSELQVANPEPAPSIGDVFWWSSFERFGSSVFGTFLGELASIKSRQRHEQRMERELRSRTASV